MTQVRPTPYIWVTWLSRLLVGDDSCIWASWYRVHYQDFRKSEGSSFDLAKWKMSHTRLLRQIRDSLRADGHTMTMEDQNAFKLTGNSRATLAGKPDMIGTAPDGRVTVYDAKTGTQKASDAAQVMIYLYALARDPGTARASWRAGWYTPTVPRSMSQPVRWTGTSSRDSTTC